MGLVFLRHAYSRYLSIKDDVEAALPSRGGKKRALSKEDFSQQSAVRLPRVFTRQRGPRQGHHRGDGIHRVVIQGFLWSDKTGLPESYTEEEVESRSDDVFRHVFRAYPTMPSPYYETGAVA
jgi:hypothetical protein